MKKFMMIIVLMIGLMSCGSGTEKTTGENVPEKDRVEVIYFHAKKRCATCRAIEENTQAVIDAMFADQLKAGTVVYRVVDITTPEGEKIADNYEVTWSSLFVNRWKDGKETRNNLTEFGFENARSNPDIFKSGLADIIHQSLE